jgi:hypothetical protein
VLGEAPLAAGVDADAADAALASCLSANEALLHRAVLKRPLSVLKYAMTLDGKIATGGCAGVAVCLSVCLGAALSLRSQQQQRQQQQRPAWLHEIGAGQQLGPCKATRVLPDPLCCLLCLLLPAAAAGHSAWVSSPASRAVVFESRAASDAVVVGGNTLRRDNPRLTTRRDSGHLPVRVVMSRTLDLPEVANLWDTQVRALGFFFLRNGAGFY